MRSAVFGSTAGAALGQLPYPYVEMVLSHGALALRVNGYLRTDEGLDGLAVAAGAVGDGLRTAAARFHAPRAFAEPLAPPRGGPPDWAPWFPAPGGLWPEAFRRAADELGLTQEDPAELHRALPRLPVPGVAQGVLRGRLPGAGVDGRLVFTAQGRGTDGTVRGAMLLPAPRDAPAFAPGGALVPETDMYVEVVDGVAAIWNRVRVVGELESAELIARGLATARQVGLLTG